MLLSVFLEFWLDQTNWWIRHLLTGGRHVSSQAEDKGAVSRSIAHPSFGDLCSIFVRFSGHFIPLIGLGVPCLRRLLAEPHELGLALAWLSIGTFSRPSVGLHPCLGSLKAEGTHKNVDECYHAQSQPYYMFPQKRFPRQTI